MSQTCPGGEKICPRKVMTDGQTDLLTDRAGPYKSPSGIRTLDLQIRSECFNSLRSASRKKTMLDSMNQNCHNI